LLGLLGTIAAMDHALQTLTSQVRDAAAARRPLRIRGGGSKDFYGQTIDATAEELDTDRSSRTRTACDNFEEVFVGVDDEGSCNGTHHV
jgi:hypothetical protein